jgi:hypothetical protein
LRWHGSDIEVISISDSLKVTTDDEEVNSVPAFGPTTFFHRGIDSMKSSMALRSLVSNSRGEYEW